ncbi:unnamed protein product, partial [Owenia fusiformis]
WGKMDFSEQWHMDKALEVIQENIGYTGAKVGCRLGFIPSSGLVISCLGELLARIINPHTALFYSNPGAVKLEEEMVRWLVEFVGMPTSSQGALVSGASIASIMAVRTAVQAKHIKARDYHRQVVYITQHTHRCIIKALKICGMVECE